MFHTVILSEEEMQVLKKIVGKFDPAIVIAPAVKPKKLSKIEQMSLSRSEYRANKKRKN